MITKILYGRKSCGKTEKLINEVCDNALFITNRCSVEYVLEMLKNKKVDVVCIEDIFSFLNEKLKLGVNYNERNEFVKIMKGEKISSIDHFFKIFDFMNRANNKLYAVKDIYIGDKQVLSNVSSIKSDKNVVSKIDFIDKIIEKIKDVKNIGYNKVLIDELFYYEDYYSELFSTLAAKAGELVIGISNISEKHKGYPIYKNSSEFKKTLEKKLENIDGMFIERICVIREEDNKNSGKEFISKYFGTDVTSDKDFDDVHCGKYNSIQEEISAIASIISELPTGEVAIALKDPVKEAPLFKSELLKNGVGVNCEIDNIYAKSPLTQIIRFLIEIKDRDIDGNDVIHFQNILKSNTRNITNNFFKRFGNNIKIALSNGIEYNKESEEIVNSVVCYIEQMKNKKAIDILNEFKHIDTNLYEKIKDIDNLEDMYVYAVSMNEFEYKADKVNIVSLKTAATKKVDYIFLPMMTEIANVNSEIISNSSIRKINSKFNSGLLSSEEKYNIVLSDIYEALLMSKKNTFLSYSVVDNDLNSQKCIKPLDNLFNTFKEYNRDIINTEKLFADLSVSLYNYKDTGAMTKDGMDAYYVLQENPDNIPKINNMINSIEKDDLSFKKEVMKDLLKDSNEFSVTRIEMFNSCPFRQAVKYGLRPKENKYYEENNATKGTFYHNAMSEISKELWDKNLTDDEYLSRSREIAEKLMSLHNEKVTVTKESLFAEKESMINRAINASLMYKNSLDRGDFKLISTEYTIEDNMTTPACNNVKLKGIIDRVDEVEIDNERYARIIDYKTSAKTISDKMMSMGLQIQLPIYASLLQTRCSGMYYAHIADYVHEEGKDETKEFQLKGPTLNNNDILVANDKLIDEQGYSSNVIQVSRNKNGELSSRSNVKTEEELEEMITQSKNIFANTVDRILDGENSIDPVLTQGINPCEYCKYKSICHIDK